MSRPNICPNCGSKNLDWGETNMGIMGDTVSHLYDCLDCEFLGEEIHELKFKGHIDRNTLKEYPADAPRPT
jgi:hypothetical protein